jgi:hypothetical protein
MIAVAKIRRFLREVKDLSVERCHQGTRFKEQGARLIHGSIDPRQDGSAGLADKSTGRRRFMSGVKGSRFKEQGTRKRT